MTIAAYKQNGYYFVCFQTAQRLHVYSITTDKQQVFAVVEEIKGVLGL